MTALLKDGRLSVDGYTAVASDGELPEAGDVLVTLERWRADRGQLKQRPGKLGVRLKSDESPEEIADDLDVLAVVALEFPVFRDGRAYSHARMLREQYHFEGELRAVGDVLLEQLHFMARAGFDAFELESDDPERDFAIAARDFSVWYQPASDTRPTALELRHRSR